MSPRPRPQSTPPAPRSRAASTPRAQLTGAADLPSRAKAFVAAFTVADAIVAVYVAVRLWTDDGHALAIVLIVMAGLGAVVIAIAVLTLVRALFSLRALPYLLGRLLRRLLGAR